MQKIITPWTALTDKEIMDYWDAVIGVGPFYADLSAARDAGELDARRRIIKTSIIPYRKDRA